jgi:hypothetical protein
MTYSARPYSALPYAADGLDFRAYFDMIMDLSASLTLKIYVSTGAGYASLPGDALPNQPFRGVLKSFSFTRSIMQNDIGQFTTGSGQLIIDNADAEYDFLPLSYAIDGRPITLKVGRRDASYDQAFTLARLTASAWNIDTDSITIDLVDFSYKLEVPMQPNVYAGTGGVDGGADLAGKRKPLCFGNPLNVSPVRWCRACLIYQVHDGSVAGIDNVYDQARGADRGWRRRELCGAGSRQRFDGPLPDLQCARPVQARQHRSRLVTADVRGENGAGYIEKSADIVRWALGHRTVLQDPADLDTGSFATVNAAQPAPIDYFIGPDDNLTVAAFIQNVMGGIGGWGGHKLDGTFEVRIFEAPSGPRWQAFTRGDMLGGDIKREPLPSKYQPPAYRWRVPYQRNWTVQTSDLAGSVSATRRAFLSQDVRLAEASSATIQTDHPFAQDRDPVASYFKNQTDAAAEAARLIDLFKTTRAIYRMTVPRRALRRDVGDQITVTHPRFDLSQGRAMIVLETAVNVVVQDGTVDSVEIAAYG